MSFTFASAARSWTRTASLILLPAAAAAQAATQAVCQGTVQGADLGWTGIDCPNCAISGTGEIQFLAEPKLRAIRGGGPADGKLRGGDVLVSLDGNLITTEAGWQRLRAVRMGQPVKVTVRRGNAVLTETITAGVRCAAASASSAVPAAPVATPPVSREVLVSGVTRKDPSPRDTITMRGTVTGAFAGGIRRADSGAMAGTSVAAAVRGGGRGGPPSAALPSQMARSDDLRAASEAALSSNTGVRLGLGLNCGSSCSGTKSAGDSVMIWVFKQPPVIESLRSGGPAVTAGLQLGDTILTVGGQSITSTSGGRLLGAAKAGDQLLLGVKRPGVAERLNFSVAVGGIVAVPSEPRRLNSTLFAAVGRTTLPPATTRTSPDGSVDLTFAVVERKANTMEFELGNIRVEVEGTIKSMESDSMKGIMVLTMPSGEVIRLKVIR